MSIKELRDKLNGSMPMGENENEEFLQQQWQELHQQLEDEKQNDERNYMEFEK